MKHTPCSGPYCAERRIHYERQDTPRGVQMVEVPDDYAGRAFCSITCAMLAGALRADGKVE